MEIVSVQYVERFKGPQIREFSKEIHGDNYLDIAKEFAQTNDGVIIQEAEVVSPAKPSEAATEADTTEVGAEDAPKKRVGRPPKSPQDEAPESAE